MFLRKFVVFFFGKKFYCAIFHTMVFVGFSFLICFFSLIYLVNITTIGHNLGILYLKIGPVMIGFPNLLTLVQFYKCNVCYLFWGMKPPNPDGGVGANPPISLQKDPVVYHSANCK